MAEKNTFKFLLISQACGAFNDNFFKTLLGLYAITKFSGEQATFIISMTGALLILPFIVFSPIAGYLADRFSKKKITVATRLVEPLIVTLGLICFHLENVYGMLFVLFLFGLQSTIFSPAKYGIIPELVGHNQISKANAHIESTTFLAILGGTFFAGQIQMFPEYIFLVSTFILLSVSLTGVSLSFFIKDTPALNLTTKFSINPISPFIKNLKYIKKLHNLFVILLATSWFWFLGALFQLSIFIYSETILEITKYETGLLLAFISVGIGVGSLFAGHVSKGKVELGLVPIGGFGIFLACFGLGFTDTFSIAGFFIFLLGLSGGIFIVPLNSYFQAYSPEKKRGSFIATSNLLNNIFMLFASLTLWILNGLLGLSTSLIFLFLAFSSLIVTYIALKYLPEMLIRCIAWTLVNLIYKVKVVGAKNIPENGGALIVCNHLSFVDPLVIATSIERPIRFLMFRPLYHIPIIHFVAKNAKAIPVSEDESKKEILKSLITARDAIKNGELVCIFAEGGISRVGNLLKFRRGFETIMKDLDAPIIPAHLDSIWGSIFSFEGGRFFFKRPKQIPYPITLSLGKPQNSNIDAFSLRQNVAELGADAFKYRSVYEERLDYRFIKSIKRVLFKDILADSSGLKLKGIQVLIASLLLRNKFIKIFQEESNIGLLLPPTIGGCLANIAVTISNKVPVNLNYTSSSESIKYSINQSNIKKIITSRTFLDKLNLNISENLECVFMEDLQSNFSLIDKIMACLMSLLPSSILYKIISNKNAKSSDLATIIFSSGSSGTPKGVRLSHCNIISNIEALYQVFRFNKNDVLLGVLPFFHSFGFTVTLWLPLVTKFKAVYHYNPIDAKTVGKLAELHKISLLLATPTFLNTYLKKCTKEQFANLRSVIVGAEKLKPVLVEEFESKFNVRPLEGYGCTELSPVVAINVPDVILGKLKQKGEKLGTVGHPLPNVAIRIVNPETFKPLGSKQDGLILVKGPNVMMGYLNNDDLTKQVIKDGWYITGDIGNLDDDGFLQITDRLSRFSKIGGEMVSHLVVEDAILKAIESLEQVVVVTSVPDDSKGEKLIVLHTIDIEPELINKKLVDAGLVNLWIPKRENFYKISEIPLLGSGKLDLKEIKGIAIKLVNEN